MQYIALLRGINVGGKNKISMPDLEEICLNQGLEEVETYINTGNILFTSHQSADSLKQKIAEGISQTLNLTIPVLVLSANRWFCIASSIPPDWTNDKVQKSDVWFLWQEFDDLETLESLPLTKGIDQALYCPGAILWSVSRENQGRSKMNKVVGTKLYKHLTIRNVNTVRKLTSLLEVRVKNTRV